MPLLERARAYLDALALLPAPAALRRGDVSLDIAGGPPASDRRRPAAFAYAPMPRPRRQLLELPPDVTISGTMYYPAAGGLGWHTDSHNPGFRVYLAKPVSAAGRFYFDGGAHDDDRALATVFRAGTWHAVFASGPRLALGLRVEPDGPTARALGL